MYFVQVVSPTSSTRFPMRTNTFVLSGENLVTIPVVPLAQRRRPILVIPDSSFFTNMTWAPTLRESSRSAGRLLDSSANFSPAIRESSVAVNLTVASLILSISSPLMRSTSALVVTSFIALFTRVFLLVHFSLMYSMSWAPAWPVRILSRTEINLVSGWCLNDLVSSKTSNLGFSGSRPNSHALASKNQKESYVDSTYSRTFWSLGVIGPSWNGSPTITNWTPPNWLSFFLAFLKRRSIASIKSAFTIEISSITSVSIFANASSLSVEYFLKKSSSWPITLAPNPNSEWSVGTPMLRAATPVLAQTA